MSNLKNFNNIYANLAESAYNTRPKNFPPFAKNREFKEINYSQDETYRGELTKGGKNLPNKGVVYLQPDKTLHAEPIKSTYSVPKVNGGYEQVPYDTLKTYQKGFYRKTSDLADYVHSFYRELTSEYGAPNTQPFEQTVDEFNWFLKQKQEELEETRDEARRDYYRKMEE